MIDHCDETEPTISRDGITVYQTYDEEHFGGPTVVLQFVSERKESAEVEVAVDLPPDLHFEEVGFHPDYGRDDWSVESERIEFSTVIGPREDVTTMYAVESLADDQLDSLLENLTIERVRIEAGDTGEQKSTADSGLDPTAGGGSEPTTGETSAEGRAGDDRKAQVETHVAGDNEEAVTRDDREGDETLDTLGLAKIDYVKVDNASDDDGESAPDEHVEPTENEATDADVDAGGKSKDVTEKTTDKADDEKTDEEHEAAHEEAYDETDTDVDATVAVERSTLAGYSTAELVAELDQRIEAGGLTDEDRERLYKVLITESHGATVEELRVANLQKRVSDLEASVEPLNDRHGSTAEAFAELREIVSALGNRVDSIEDEASAATDWISEVQPRLADLEQDVDSLAEEQAELESEVSSLTAWRERVRSTLSALRDE